MTVVGSNAAHASALPPNSRAMVCALVPEFGPMSPAMSTNALNISGCITVRSTAQVPPIDQPTTPQLARSALTPKLRHHVRHNVFGQMIGGVAAAPVDAFGVVVERASGIDEHQHRRVAAVGGREFVDRA